MNILVTGGAGFIGSHIVDQFVGEGHRVSVIDDLSTGTRKQVHREAVFYKLNVCDSRIERVFRKERPVVIVHMAAQVNVRKSTEDPAFDAEVNIIGTLQLLKLAVRYGARKIVFASSGGTVYGEQEVFPASEAHPTRPLSPYGISKLTCEYYLEHYRRVAGLKYVALRLANIYGPRQNADGEAGVVAIFTQSMLKGEQPRIHGNGFQTRDYVYVGDVVEAVRAVFVQPVEGIFNVGTGTETTVNEIFARLKELTNSPCQEIHGPAKKGEQLRSVLDASKLEKDTAWTHAVSLSEGLDETVKFFQQQRR
jgi:UDP-glucose 4-epimerase